MSRIPADWGNEDEDDEDDEDEDDVVSVTVTFVCVACGYTKYNHYRRNDLDEIDIDRHNFIKMHGSDHEVVLAEYVWEE